MSRRHPELSATPQNPKLTQMERELEQIKERLRTTESDLAAERSARVSGGHTVQPVPGQMSGELALILQKELNDKKNELQRLKDEFKKNKITLNKELHEMNEKNVKLEKNIKDLQERLGKQSHVGWIKDDVDLEKDNLIKLKKENEVLSETVIIIWFSKKSQLKKNGLYFILKNY